MDPANEPKAVAGDNKSGRAEKQKRRRASALLIDAAGPTVIQGRARIESGATSLMPMPCAVASPNFPTTGHRDALRRISDGPAALGLLERDGTPYNCTPES